MRPLQEMAVNVAQTSLAEPVTEGRNRRVFDTAALLGWRCAIVYMNLNCVNKCEGHFECCGNDCVREFNEFSPESCLAY